MEDYCTPSGIGRTPVSCDGSEELHELYSRADRLLEDSAYSPSYPDSDDLEKLPSSVKKEVAGNLRDALEDEDEREVADVFRSLSDLYAASD